MVTRRSGKAARQTNAEVGHIASEPPDRERRLGSIVSRLLNGEEVKSSDVDAGERTARADIAAINNLRTLRTPGGISPRTGYHQDQLLRMVEAKQDVAEETARKFHKYQSVAAGAGTTVMLTCAALRDRGLPVPIISNNAALLNLEMASSSAGANPSLIFVGGDFDPGIMGVVGEAAIEGFGAQKVKCGLLGVSGIEGDGKLYVKHRTELSVMKAMLESVEERLFLVASVDKLGHSDLWQIGEISELAKQVRRVVLITNDPKEWKGELLELPEDEWSHSDAGVEAVEQTLEALQSLAETTGEAFEVVLARRRRK